MKRGGGRSIPSPPGGGEELSRRTTVCGLIRIAEIAHEGVARRTFDQGIERLADTPAAQRNRQGGDKNHCAADRGDQAERAQQGEIDEDRRIVTFFIGEGRRCSERRRGMETDQ